jgi:hypothetical protein
MKVIRLLQLTAKNRTRRETRPHEKKNIAIGVEETRTNHTANSLHIGAHKDTGVHGALEINLIGAANLYGATSPDYVLA